MMNEEDAEIAKTEDIEVGILPIIIITSRTTHDSLPCRLPERRDDRVRHSKPSAFILVHRKLPSQKPQAPSPNQSSKPHSSQINTLTAPTLGACPESGQFLLLLSRIEGEFKV